MNAKTGFTGPDLCKLTACEAVDLLKRKDISPKEMLAASLDRISEVEPAVNAIVTVCAERAIAQAGDALGDPEHPGYLAGLPIAIKDLTAVKGVRTTFGTKALADNIPLESDPLVETLESRGAVIVGKTNTPEMGAGANTFNAVFGATRNPWDTAKNAGGSSGGAAVSLATGEVWLSHGSDLAGSLRTPAAYCGVVGLRPSPGRAGGGPGPIGFSREGIAGPMARNVSDTALFLDAMAGFDARWPISIETPAVSFQDMLGQNPGDIRVGFSPNLNGFAEVEPAVEADLRAAIAKIESAGIPVDEVYPELEGLEPTYNTIRGVHYGALTANLPVEIQQHFKATLQANIEFGLNLTAEDIFAAERQRTVIYHTMRHFLEKWDVLACAVIGTQAGPVEVEYPASVNGVAIGDYVEWLRFSFLPVVAGLPAISIPCGFTADGMPVGIQLIGPPRGEARLLQVAKRLEDVWGFASGLPIDPIVNS
jgi:amidase